MVDKTVEFVQEFVQFMFGRYMDVVTGGIVLMICVEPPSKMVENTVEPEQFEFGR